MHHNLIVKLLLRPSLLPLVETKIVMHVCGAADLVLLLERLHLPLERREAVGQLRLRREGLSQAHPNQISFLFYSSITTAARI